jgi:hypothetical protein
MAVILCGRHFWHFCSGPSQVECEMCTLQVVTSATVSSQVFSTCLCLLAPKKDLIYQFIKQ